MSRTVTRRNSFVMLDELLDSLGGVAPKRIRMKPAPGTANVKDVALIMDRENRLFELIDGVLVEKVIGYPEAFLATKISHWISSYLDQNDLGIVVGSDGAVELMSDLVRIPDVSFVAWDRLPGRKVPTDPIPELAPDLAVEVLSDGNTAAEMQRKLEDYFRAGVRLVWYVDPQVRTVTVYAAPDKGTTLRADQPLDGGAVLPGFRLPLQTLFDTLGGRSAKRPRKKS